ncbi:GTPase HflX [Candidatus Contubernalis alkalaceticus]|uniref:GTPase HflX n=1 Tax=Candidatus Contubernalis alkaliaceticus TaxID=338645 RepID=UPI00387E6313
MAGILLPGREEWHLEASMRELAQLSDTAGAEVVFEVVQKRSKPHASYYIGKGKAEEISLLAEEVKADMLIIDDELTPSQAKNLEELLELRVIDRTALILDIFAQRARTREGKLQVELAQLNYLLPRLTGHYSALSRLGGGIGTRGPGETKLEVDRRTIRQKISDLNKEIESIKKHRSLQRRSRQKVPFPVIALVGYTNAGKSTLLNALTDSSVFTEDKLFATLDPTTRRVNMTDNQTVLITDTVGFIQKLPTHLVAAFRATLEEVQEADVLMHVVDLSHPQMEEQMEAVHKILMDLEVTEKRCLLVFNKMDLNNDPFLIRRLKAEYPNSVAISAGRRKNLEELMDKLSEILRADWERFTFTIPFEDSRTIALLHEKGQVVSMDVQGENYFVEVFLQEKWANKLKKYTQG